MALEDKKWTQEECRQRYITTQISYAELSKISGVSESTILRWSQKSDPSWPEQRIRFGVELRQETTQVVKRRLKDRLADIALRHLKHYELVSDTAAMYFRAVRREFLRKGLDLPEGSPVPDHLHPEYEESFAAAAKTLPWGSLGVAAKTLAMAIEGERQSLGMEYLDINRAIKAVERTGLKVVVPEGADVLRVGPEDDLCEAGEPEYDDCSV